MPPTSPCTGDHVADLMEFAESEQIRWVVTTTLSAPHWIADPISRIVYVDGQLEISLFYAAIAAGVRALVGTLATVTQLRPRTTDHHSDTG